MRALYYFLIGVVLFYIDTIVGLLIPMQIGSKAIIFVPHLTLMYILIVCIYRSFGVALVFGFGFIFRGILWLILVWLYFVSSCNGLFFQGVLPRQRNAFYNYYSQHYSNRNICSYYVWSNWPHSV